MSNSLTRFLTWGGIIFYLISCSSCTPESETESVAMNGKIVYSVEFPFIEDKTLLKWFPTEYTTIFNEDEIYGEMNSKMNVISNRFYSNQKKFTVNQTLENMSGKYRCEMEREKVFEVVKKMPEMIISEPFGDTTIVGLSCKMAMAEFKIDSVPPVVLYYTDEINVSQPNWFNQYNKLDKFLLGYEVEQFGMRMKLMAKEYSQTEQQVDVATVFGSKNKESYDSLVAEELQIVIKEMLQDFME